MFLIAVIVSEIKSVRYTVVISDVSCLYGVVCM